MGLRHVANFTYFASFVTAWVVVTAILTLVDDYQWSAWFTGAVVVAATLYVFTHVNTFISDRIASILNRIDVYEIGRDGTVSDEDRKRAEAHGIRPPRGFQVRYFEELIEHGKAHNRESAEFNEWLDERIDSLDAGLGFPSLENLGKRPEEKDSDEDDHPGLYL